MAGDWLQIDHDLPDKPEVLGIVARTGELPETVVGRLFKLWRLADRQTFDGVIPHATPVSLSAIVGGPKEFWEAVIVVGWLVPSPDGLAVPDFEERFGKSAKRRMLDSKRKQSSRGADEMRTDVRTPSGRNADRCPHDERTDCGQVADPESVSESTPESPSESEPESNSSSGSASAEPRAAGAAPRAAGQDRSEEIRQVFDHYRAYHPKAHPTPHSGSKEWRAIAARLKGGYSAQDLCRAIDGCHKSPFHCGENPGGTIYQNLELIVRDDAKVAQFLELADAPPRPVHSEKTRRTIRAVEAWANGGSGNG